jgi:dienelactone hydrolase
MREERIDNGGVPAKLYDPGDARGLLLFGHGGAHSKDSERFVRMCRSYADQTGLATVCIDAVDHGERKPNGVSTGLPARWHSTATEQMVADWQNTVDGLASIGPALAYVGWSMGMIFGATSVAAMASMKAAVFGVGGLPTGRWIDDPPLRAMLLDAASNLAHPQVLMLNMTQDQLFGLKTPTAFSTRSLAAESGSCSGKASTMTGRLRQSVTPSTSLTSTHVSEASPKRWHAIGRRGRGLRIALRARRAPRTVSFWRAFGG